VAVARGKLDVILTQIQVAVAAAAARWRMLITSPLSPATHIKYVLGLVVQRQVAAIAELLSADRQS